MQIQLAFYKGDGNIFDWGVRKVTSSLYSHSELIINDISYSSRIEDFGVKYKYRRYLPNAWDIIEIDTSKIDLELLQKVHNDAIGFGYDYVGVLRFILPFLPQSSTRYFCSELNAEALGIKDAWKYSPESLYQYAIKNLKKD